MRNRTSQDITRWALGCLAILVLVPSRHSFYAQSIYSVTKEEIAFSSQELTLSGTLWLPQKTGPHPAIVTAHGSGYTTRNDHFIRGIAEYFSKLGIAVLAFDKRGTGKSGGKLPPSNETGIRIFAKDVVAAINYVKSRDDIDSTQIGLEGISQAGWIIPMAAVASN